jgi:hypothetical protein
MRQIAKQHNWAEDDLTTAVYLLDESGPVSLVILSTSLTLVSPPPKHVSHHFKNTKQ